MVTSVAALRKPFPRYWLSGFLAEFGDGVRLAALPLLAVQLTRSPAAIAAITAIQSLPWLAGPVLGVVVDRTDRRRLMAVTDTARAAVIAALAGAILARADGLALIYLTAIATGVGSALRGTAAVACVPRLVDPGGLDRANGQMIAGQIVGNELAGPAAGGWLFGVAAVLPFAVNAGALGIAVLLLLTLPSVFQPARKPGRPGRDPGPAGPARKTGEVRRDLVESLAWLRRHSDIRDLTFAVGVISAMDAAWFAVLVLYVIRVLHARPGAYGLLLAVGAVGGIAAGAGGARIARRLGARGSLLLAGLAMAGSQLVLGLTSNMIAAAAMLAVSSGAFALFNMIATTLRQRRVPDSLLGRVSSLYGTVAGGAESLGALAGGGIAAAAGVRATMLAGAAPIAVVTAWAWWRHRLSALPAPAAGPPDPPPAPPAGGCDQAGGSLTSWPTYVACEGDNMADLNQTAARLVRTGKGILAADESISTMNSRLAGAGVAATEENRRAYREMLITTPGLSEGASGVILCDETFRQRLSDGRAFPEAMDTLGLLAGIKVDTGAKPLAGSPGETVTEGLDGLRERLTEYADLGARFAKWRAVFTIGDGVPSWRGVRADAHALTRYACLCQEAGIVPIVEPEVIMDGSHSMDQCAAVTSAVLLTLFAELQDYAVALDGIVLKPNMVVPGTTFGKTADPDEVASRTVDAFANVVPEQVAGIAFLSGGQSPDAATANLAAMQRVKAPWPLTFSFGRALVGPALTAWRGDPGRVPDGQRALANRVACNLAALRGGYRPADAESYALA